MKTTLLLVGAALLSAGTSAQAQFGQGNRGNNRGNGRNTQGNGGGALPLPEGVERVVSIDAFNILLAQTNRNGQRDLSPIIVRHIYSGGVARLFGGDTVPTELFVTPGAFGGANNGRNGGGNRGGFGQTGIGGAGGGLGGGIGGFGGAFGGAQNTLGAGGGIIGGTGNVDAGNLSTGNIEAFQVRPSALRRRN